MQQPNLSSTADGQIIQFQGWLTDTDRQTLTFFTAYADAFIERQIVTDHRNLLHGFNTGANQRRAFHRFSDPAFFDQIGF